MLAAIRIDLPRPPVHARNLFHLSAAMWDAWAAYDADRRRLLHAPRTADVAAIPARDRDDRDQLRRLPRPARTRFQRSAEAPTTAGCVREPHDGARLRSRRTPPPTGDTPAALGNRIAAAVHRARPHRRLERGRQLRRPHLHAGERAADREAAGHRRMADPNRWQPLALDSRSSQNGIPIPGKVQIYVGSQWSDVTPFALTRATRRRLPRSGTAAAARRRRRRRLQGRHRSSHPLLAASSTPTTASDRHLARPRSGNNPLGTNDGTGYPVNRSPAQPYAPQIVQARRLRARARRVLGRRPDVRDAARPLERASPTTSPTVVDRAAHRRHGPGRRPARVGREALLRAERRGARRGGRVLGRQARLRLRRGRSR